MAGAVLVVGLAQPVAAGNPTGPDSDPAQTGRTPVCAVQGSGVQSPMVGTVVTLTGEVTSNFARSLGGFHIQDLACDDDPSTSDAIFVYDPDGMATPAVGQWLQVVGRVQEYFGLTELTLSAWSRIDPPTPAVAAPAPLELPADPAEAAAYLESLECMLVTLVDGHVVGATDAYGETYVVPDPGGPERLYRGTPTGRKIALITPGWWLALDHGDVVGDVEGPLHFSFDEYAIAVRQGDEPYLDRQDREPERLGRAGLGQLRVASYNLENFFDSVNDPAKNDDQWTLSPAQYRVGVERRAQSIARLLHAPDILGVQEVENIEVLRDLAASSALSGAGYEAVLEEGVDERGIDVGFLFNARRLELVEHHAEPACVAAEPIEPKLTCTLTSGEAGWLLFSRPPLVATFRDRPTGTEVTVVVNHFKSKSGGDAETTPTRVAQAVHVSDLVGRLKADAPWRYVIVIGDLNDFEDSEPLHVLALGGLEDLHNRVPDEGDYTFVFKGVSQILDYILVPFSQELPGCGRSKLAFRPVHINTDFGSGPANDPGASIRVSDHDPVVASFTLSCEPVFLPALYQELAIGGDEPTPTERPRATVAPVSTPSPTAQPQPSATPTVSAGPPRFPLAITELFFDGNVPMTEADEYLELTNVSGEPVALAGWRVVSVQGSQEYRFSADASIAAGQTCRVYTNEAHPEWCGFDWASGQAIWRNSGDKAELRNPANDLVDWYCYGSSAEDCRVTAP